MTPLISAALSGRGEVCNVLVKEMKANVNKQDVGQDTALYKAARYNYISIVELLIKNGAKNLKNKNNETALDYARQSKREEMIKLLESHFNQKQL